MAVNVKSRAEQIVEAKIGETIEAAIRRMYLDDGLTQAEVAVRLGVSRQSVVNWMGKYGIESRHTPTPSEAVA
jgi:DNA-binding transcriptional regulator YiaG